MFRLQPDEVDNSLRIFLSVTSLFAQQPAPFNHLSHASICAFSMKRVASAVYNKLCGRPPQ